LMAPPGGLLISTFGYGTSVPLAVISATACLKLVPVLVLLGSRPEG
jgi:hypothetical protein